MSPNGTGRSLASTDAARPSLSWWEHFGRSYRSMPPWQFAFHFFSRSLPASKLRQRDAAFVESVHRAWGAAHGGAMDPLHTPIDVAGVTQPGRVVTVEDGAVGLAAGPLPLRPGPGRVRRQRGTPRTASATLSRPRPGPWRRAPAWWPWPAAPR